MTDRTQLPVACTLSEPDLAKRRAGLFADLARHQQEVRWLPEGITLRYSPEQGTLVLLGDHPARTPVLPIPALPADGRARGVGLSGSS